MNTDSTIDPGLDSSGESGSPAAQETGAPAPFFDPASVYDKVGKMYQESGVLEPIFQEYNKKYTDAIAKYQPYEPFFDHEPNKLAAALQLFDTIDTPEGARQIYDGIARLLNITPAEAKEVVKEAQEEDPGEQEPEDPYAQKMRELDERQAQFEQYMQSQRLEKDTGKQESVIDQEWSKIVAADPDLGTNKVRAEHLMNRVFGLVQQHQGTVPLPQLFQQAYTEQQTYNQNFYDSMNAQGRPAPRVMSPTGSNPGSGVNPADRDADQRKSAMAQRLREALSSQ